MPTNLPCQNPPPGAKGRGFSRNLKNTGKRHFPHARPSWGTLFLAQTVLKLYFRAGCHAQGGVYTARTCCGGGGAAGPRNSGNFAHGAAFVAGDWGGFIWHEGQGAAAFCSAAAFSISPKFRTGAAPARPPPFGGGVCRVCAVGGARAGGKHLETQCFPPGAAHVAEKRCARKHTRPPFRKKRGGQGARTPFGGARAAHQQQTRRRKKNRTQAQWGGAQTAHQQQAQPQGERTHRTRTV